MDSVLAPRDSGELCFAECRRHYPLVILMFFTSPEPYLSPFRREVEALKEDKEAGGLSSRFNIWGFGVEGIRVLKGFGIKGLRVRSLNPKL